jgi:hypothetical protein
LGAAPNPKVPGSIPGGAWLKNCEGSGLAHPEFDEAIEADRER